jgi:shikimate kinase
MTIILTGFMGTGKSTVGKVLADRLGVPFIDTDVEVERVAGRPIKEIFREDGESYFRQLERRAIATAVLQDAVVATGGGAIVDAENYERMHAAGPIVCLVAPPEVIVQRIAANQDRPLLHGDDPGRRVRQLLAERAAAYARADHAVDTSTRSVEAVVEEILSLANPPLERERLR